MKTRKNPGIELIVIYYDLNKFICCNIAPRSLGLNLSNGTMMWEYKKSLEQGFSIAAVDTEGKILGVRIGVILKK